ncbi:MAG: Sec-independent protein translocase protein TatA [Candidatus Collierbacteria bacterium GW2011_GWB1_44_197]|uniref:Sec-independent protein translocase protein TatA n=1 Tax=Candidatus Collierbacteria bacterium GW2011_GWB2_44_22 TaxID=1618387 RepID=A0A0G1K5Z1_9BACT|nr:MAG: Sec-independent protein translocase protein TatA [Candidatus Collierbacteria bacterium GW2011_GWB1_44_197]KKT51727.1 MAG: Sec-independent protein translocase protein TatA [Candidatus Collierbacteria bacterium GW2011_GWB2_44_22]KKT66946.1 MAG: Sec-independent protein translocase protein TatA [Candidatus Collierbacteria bacterium GW2011_GWC2_44_30]
MPNIGLNEIIIVAIVIVVLFGSRALPNFIRGIAKAIREFRHAKKGDE